MSDTADVQPQEALITLEATTCFVATSWALAVVVVVITAVQWNKRANSSNWHLFMLTALVVFTTALRHSVYLGFVVPFSQGVLNMGTWNAYIFFKWLAYSCFLALLLLVACGYKITRHHLGDRQPRVIGIPLIVLFTGLVTDYIYYALAGQAHEHVKADNLTGLEILFWFICSMVNLATLVLSWVYIFDLVKEEVDALEEKHTGVKTVQMTDQGSAEQGDSAPVTEGDLLPPGANASHLGVRDEEAGVVETVEERVGYTLKRGLMRSFSICVTAYFIATMCAILLPIFMPDILAEVIMTIWHAIHLMLLAALVWIFRPQQHNPYLMLGESDDDAAERGLDGLDTGLDLGDDDDSGDDAHALQNGGDQRWDVAAGRTDQVASSPGKGAPQLPVSTSPDVQPRAGSLGSRNGITAIPKLTSTAHYSLDADDLDGTLDDVRLSSEQPGTRPSSN